MTSDIVPDTSSTAMRELMEAYGVSAALGFPMNAPTSSALYRVDVKSLSGQSFDLGENVYAASHDDADILVEQIFARKLFEIIVTYSKATLPKHPTKLFKIRCSVCGSLCRWHSYSLVNAYTVAYWVRRGIPAEVAVADLFLAPESPAFRGKLTSVEFFCEKCTEEERGEEVDLLDYPEIFEHDFMIAMMTAAGYEVIVHRIVLSTPSFETEMNTER